MNKRAFKIYKNNKDKEREEIEFFQLQSCENLLIKSKPIETKTRLRKKRYVTNLVCNVPTAKDGDFEKGENDKKRYNTA